MDRLRFLLRKFRERLWIKPALFALGAVALVALAVFLDRFELPDFLPEIDDETLNKLLSIISASMLGVATFAVASMVSAYASASRSATPRAFQLIVADNMSQRALSAFIGAYIFSIVALIAVQSTLLQATGNFVLFCAILTVLGWVIVTFVTWVDSIARLGRMGDTIEKIDNAAGQALERWGPARRLGGADISPAGKTVALDADDFGHVQHIDVQGLQAWADENDARVFVDTPPGSFVIDSQTVARIETDAELTDDDLETLHDSFIIGSTRSYADDPRFGLIALSEIGSRALSPAVNDPGTAIDVIKRLTETLSRWGDTLSDDEDPDCGRVFIPRLSIEDCLEDAFQGIERDGAQTVEVAIWLQKAYERLSHVGHPGLTAAARQRAAIAMERAEGAMDFEHDLERLRAVRRSLNLG